MREWERVLAACIMPYQSAAVAVGLGNDVCVYTVC